MGDYTALQIWKATKAKLVHLQGLYLKRGVQKTLVELVEELVNSRIVELQGDNNDGN
jgi:hypothetical protein